MEQQAPEITAIAAPEEREAVECPRLTPGPELRVLKAPEKKEEEKKKGGLWDNIAAKIAGGGAMAAGGAGAGGAGLGGAMLGGGILATKAGILALLAAGSIIAGGVGLIGYKVFGGGRSASERAEQANALFASHPKRAVEDLEGVDAEQKLASTAKDGSSSSLQFLADANNTLPLDKVEKNDDKKETSDAGANASASAPPAPTLDAAAAAKSAAAISGPAANGNAPSMGPAAKMTFSTKIGQLSSGTGGGASGAHFGASGGIGSSAPMDPSRLLAGLSKPGNAAAMAGGSRAALSGKGVGAAGRRGGAVRQLNNVLHDQRAANTSADAGRTYDGGARTGGTTGSTQGGPTETPMAQTPSQNTPGGGGSIANSNGALPEAPPDAEGKNVTPWQKQMTVGKALMGGAIAAILAGWLLAKKAEAIFNAAAVKMNGAMVKVNALRWPPIPNSPPSPPYPSPDSLASSLVMDAAAHTVTEAAAEMETASTMQKLSMAMWGAAGLAFLGVLAIGANIMGGQYGQMTAGLSFALGGGFGAVSAGLAVKSILPSIATTDAMAKMSHYYAAQCELDAGLFKTGNVAAGAKMKVDTTKVAVQAISGAQQDTAMNALAHEQIEPLGTGPLLMSVCGAAAVVAFGVTMLTSPKQVPQRDCTNHRCHDLSFRALSSYIG